MTRKADSAGSINDEAIDEQELELDLDESAHDLDSTFAEAVAAVEERKEARRREHETGEPALPGTDETAAGGDSATGGAVDSSETARLRQEIRDLRERSVRTLADFDNFRKRVEREKAENRRYALMDPMRELLPVMDNFSRALSADGSAEDLKTGVKMIHKQMEDLLRRFGVEAIEAEGEPFDPAFHEAVSKQESSEVSQPTVHQEHQTGYMMHSRLLRPSMVSVAVPAKEADGGDDEA